MNEDLYSGVQIGEGASYIRLRRRGGLQDDSHLIEAEFEVKAGPISGVVHDGTLAGVGNFCAELQSLYDRLTGRATLTSYEGFDLTVEGDGRGGISGVVEIYAKHIPLSKLIFEVKLDQSFLPDIIRELRKEFPEG